MFRRFDRKHIWQVLWTSVSTDDRYTNGNVITIICLNAMYRLRPHWSIMCIMIITEARSNQN